MKEKEDFSIVVFLLFVLALLFVSDLYSFEIICCGVKFQLECLFSNLRYFRLEKERLFAGYLFSNH